MLASALAAAPVKTVDGAISLMAAIDAALPDDDGLKWFNRLYLRVTEAVGREVGRAGLFADRAFIERLDVVFANLYFEAALAAAPGGPGAPPAWQPLFESRAARRARIQHALAGMNAHINRDLPLALVRTYRALGGDPRHGGPRHGDFDRVNDILEKVEGDVRHEFSVGLVGLIDRAAGDLDDVVAMWKVRRARDAAWTNAEVLWTLDVTPRLAERFFDRLDRLAGFAGRGLLVPLRSPAAGPARG